MSTSVIGSGTFLDLYTPLKGKSEWGMDTLTRKGHIARVLAEAFIATLEQGDPYPAGNPFPYYLQTWDVDDNPNVATITLNYKGLAFGGTPIPRQESGTTLVLGKTTKDYSGEGIDPDAPDGLGRFYRKDLIWSMDSPPGPSDNGRAFKGYRDRYALSASMEFMYRAGQTVYRYISVGRPSRARFNNIGFSYDTEIEKARITLSDGMVYEGRAKEVFFELTPVARDRAVDFQTIEVVGTPFWETTDVVRRELVNAD